MKLNQIIRIVFSILLVATIWCRVDWSVGILALLLFIRFEAQDIPRGF